MSTFDKVISLGPSCETAYQIRQIIEQEEAYVFDWVIASSACVARAIATDFGEFIRPSNLRLSNAGGQAFIADALTRFEFHHDFRNDISFLETLPDVQQKYNYLIARTRKLFKSESSVLFIHQNGTSEDALHLDAVLSDRYPSLKYAILELTCGGQPGLSREGRIILARIPGHGSTWQERTPQWAALLEEFLSESYGGTLKRRDPATWDPVPTPSA